MQYFVEANKTLLNFLFCFIYTETFSLRYSNHFCFISSVLWFSFWIFIERTIQLLFWKPHGFFLMFCTSVTMSPINWGRLPPLSFSINVHQPSERTVLKITYHGSQYWQCHLTYFLPVLQQHIFFLNLIIYCGDLKSPPASFVKRSIEQ